MPECVPSHTAFVLGMGVFSQLGMGRPESSRTPGLENKSIYMNEKNRVGPDGISLEGRLRKIVNSRPSWAV